LKVFTNYEKLASTHDSQDGVRMLHFAVEFIFYGWKTPGEFSRNQRELKSSNPTGSQFLRKKPGQPAISMPNCTDFGQFRQIHIKLTRHQR